MYVYKCHGTRYQCADDMHNCPVCGQETYDFLATVSHQGKQMHGRLESVEGIRNYFDVGAGRYFHTEKERLSWLKKKGYKPAVACGASGYESWED
jgi:hypothetical protein